jgi:signal transduction histidine kinase
MKNYFKGMDRGVVTTFSRNYYEVVFSIFMIALAYFYRSSPQINYPLILYFFLVLLGSNFAFNYLLRRRASVNIWLIDLILLANFWIITGVMYCSGRGESYFWVLYLLPVFGASLMGSLKDTAGIVFLCSLAIMVMSWPLGGGELSELLSLAVKIGVLFFSAGVVYSTAQSRKKAEAGLAFKRDQVANLEREITEKESEIVKTASAGEVGTLVSGVMHDLGNAVSVVMLSAQIALEDEKPDKKDIERIMKASRFAKGLISNAMSIVRGQEYVFESASLKEPIENAEALTEYTARKKSSTIVLDVPEDLPLLRISKVHVERIFINSIFNALSFIPEKGVVRVKVRACEGGVNAEISDNGPGFPPKMLKEGVKAFGTTRKEKGGTGLGLFVCDQIARRHGGTMKIDNAPEGGARISIFFPSAGPEKITSRTSTL